MRVCCCVLLVHVEVEKLKVMTLNTHRFSRKSAEKVVFHRFYQTCLIISVVESVVKSVRKSADF